MEGKHMSTIDEEGRIHIEDDDARGAVSNTGLRWVLGIGLVLALIAMSAVWIIPALWGE
jgi:hypothetical protein